jgi:hypothetical protein
MFTLLRKHVTERTEDGDKTQEGKYKRGFGNGIDMSPYLK